MTAKTLFAPGAKRAMLSAAPDINIQTHDHPQLKNTIILDLILIPASERRQNLGTRALIALTEYADTHNLTILLTADNTFGTPLRILYAFYASHGFVPTQRDDGYTHIRIPG